MIIKYSGRYENMSGPNNVIRGQTGRNFYKNYVILSPWISLKLVKEANNEFDNDAIAVYAEDEKICYVANKDYTN